VTAAAEKSSGLRYAVIGAGMAGILAGIRLKQSGDNFTIFEKADRLGGTWRENRYPGLTCDVPAHAYTYSFEPYAEWKAYYATGGEIQDYFVKTAEKHGVTPHIRFNSEIDSCVWDDSAAQWTLRTVNGDAFVADVVIAASGVLHHPKMPDIPGLSSFEGKAFHSARWDDSAKIDGARVGIVGNGSTGVQIVTALAERSAKVVHFQRSPQWIMPVPYFEYTNEQREAFRKNPALIDEIRNDKQYWDNIHRFCNAIMNIDGPEIAAVEEACRQNLENSIKDPVLREKLRPSYRAACKRLIYSWSYYDAVQKPNVFVDIGGIERVEATGVRMKDGTLHELDTLVLATGFHADRFIRPASVLGVGGRSLDDAWKVRPTAYYAVTLPDFPNLFLLNGPTGPVGNFSLIDIAERQWGYIEQLLAPLREGTAKAVTPKQSALDAYEEKRIAAAKKTIFGSGCKSWYLDDTGVPASWPWSYDAFADAMANPVSADYEFA
jgi:cation diffusion facilitator CzcD-associated flavoprotein CzcO